jgi:acetyl-CoA/propionyl-CoA carboxylase biotin carboxyl carrier protein
MLRALGEYEIEGLTTLIPFHKAILATKQWANGETARDLTEDKKWLKTTAPEEPPKPAEEGEAEKVSRDYSVEVGGKLFDVKVIGEAGAVGGVGAAAKRPPRRERKSGGGSANTGDTVVAPLQGNVWKLPVKKGDAVKEGDVVCIIEAMKMENEITAHKAGKITELMTKEGDSINTGDPIAKIE